MAGKMVVVIEFDEPPGPEEAQHILHSVRDIFKDQNNVHAYGATRESADDILNILNSDMADG